MSDFVRSDLGLQPERVELAWRRTFLALTVGICLGIRATQKEFGATSVLLAAFAFALIAFSAGLHRRRAKLQMAEFHGHHLIPRTDAVPIILTGLAVMLMSAFAIVWFVVRLG